MSIKKKRKIWWVVGVSFSVVLFVAYALGLGSGVKLNRELAKARANGFPVEAEDVFTKPVPKDEDNAARFYEQMVLLEEPASFEYSKLSNHGEALRRGYSDYDRDKVSSYLDANSELLALAEMAARKPDWEAGKDWTNPVSVLLPELKLSKDASIAFVIRAMLSLEDGDVTTALEDLQRVLTIAGHMENAGYIIGNLVAFADRQIYFRAVEQMATFPAADEEFFRGVLMQVEEWPAKTDWTDVLRLEAFSNAWIMRNYDDFLDEYYDYGGWSFSDGLPKDDYDWEQLSRMLPRTRSDAALSTIEHWQHVLDTYDPDSADPMAWARGIDAKTTTGSGFWHASEALAMEFVMPFESTIGAGFRDSARRAVLESSLIALLAKRSGRGYLADGTLTDPWTKTDLLFKESSDGFLLYSVGRNGMDDSGDKLRDNDIVFEFPRTRSPAPADYYYD